MTRADPETLAVYDRDARAYGDRFADGPPDPSLAAFIAAMPQGARVLDLGCGMGRDAARMRNAGLDVTALDAAPGMAAEAARRYGLAVTLADFDALPTLGRFAGIWASFSLLHAARDDLPRHLAAIRAALVPPGRFTLGMKTGTGTHRDALGRRYTYVTEAELETLLDAAGFAVTHRRSGATTGFDGARAPWVVLEAQAAGPKPHG